MRPHTIDEHWDLLSAEYDAVGRPVPYIARVSYRWMRRWLRWLIVRAA